MTTKSPANQVFGRALQERRKALGLSDDVALARSLNLSSAHWRLVESGSIPCPATAAFTLSSQMSWNYYAVAQVLVGIEHADIRDRRSRAIDAPAVWDRLEELSRMPGELQNFWIWCRERLRKKDALSPEPAATRSDAAIVEELLAFLEKPFVEEPTRQGDVLDEVEAELARRDDPDAIRAFREARGNIMKRAAQTVGEDRLPFRLRSMMTEVRATVSKLEGRLSGAIQLIRGVDGTNRFYADHKTSIRTCIGFLSYLPAVAHWRDSELDLGFLNNRYPPAPDDARITLFAPPDAGLPGLEKQFSSFFTKAFGKEGSDKKESEQTFVHIRPRQDDPVCKFIFSLLSRDVQCLPASTIKPESNRIIFENFWIFEMFDGERFYALEDYNPVKAAADTKADFLLLELPEPEGERLRTRLHGIESERVSAAQDGRGMRGKNVRR